MLSTAYRQVNGERLHNALLLFFVNCNLSIRQCCTATTTEVHWPHAVLSTSSSVSHAVTLTSARSWFTSSLYDWPNPTHPAKYINTWQTCIEAWRLRAGHGGCNNRRGAFKGSARLLNLNWHSSCRQPWLRVVTHCHKPGSDCVIHRSDRSTIFTLRQVVCQSMEHTVLSANC